MKSKAQLKNDILKAIDNSNENYYIRLGLYYEFERELPDEAKKAENYQYTTLDLENYYDCHTAKQLRELATIDCTEPTPGYVKNITVRFHQAYVPNLVLGSNPKINNVIREGHDVEN